MPFHDKMQCTVTKLEYDFVTKTGTVWSPVSSVPNLSGSVAVFTAIDPAARLIRHHEGSHVTTVYSRQSGTWKSELF